MSQSVKNILCVIIIAVICSCVNKQAVSASELVDQTEEGNSNSMDIMKDVNNTEMNQSKENSYFVEFTSSLCNFEICINDMPAYTHSTGESISSQMPINPYILTSGSQQIEINILPLEGEDNLRKEATIKTKVVAYDLSTFNFEDNIEAYALEETDFHENNLPVSVLAEFNAEVNYTVEGWENAVYIEEEDEYKEEIIRYYQSFHNLFKKKEIDKIYNEMKDKFREMDISMYLGNDEDNIGELKQLIATLDKENFTLQPFPENPILNIYANGKVCTLTGVENTPIIYYRNKKQMMSSFFRFI
ncbi:MAG: hypothetical protein LUH15_13910 [Tannerellaceae bacterium]|nr:hypothetical protein [Tannerellaceae bacterium]